MEGIPSKVLLIVAVLFAQMAFAELPPPKQGGVYVIAHRGAHNGIPENSLAAYEKAIELGADFVEIDVRTTRDGQLVSVHDSTIDKYVDGRTGKVREMSLAELKALDIGIKQGPEHKGMRIPTLDEILTLCKDRIGIYIDLKDADVAKVADAVRRHGMDQNVVWFADDDDIARLIEVCPTCIPMPDPYGLEKLQPLIDRFHPDVIAAVWREYSKEFVEICHESGALVFVDESDPSCWEDALEWGSDGIQTDHPGKLIEFLKSRER